MRSCCAFWSCANKDAKTDESVESLQERGELAAGTPTLEEDGSAKELSDPTKLVYVDYENPFELQRAMQARSHIVETMSPNAWVSCGGDTYVLDVPRFGFVKVERAVQTGEADNLNSPGRFLILAFHIVAMILADGI